MRKFFKVLIAAIWTSGVIVRYARIVVYRLSGRHEDLAFGLEYAFFFILAVLSFPYIAKRINLSALLLYLVFTAVYVLSLLFSSYHGAAVYLEENLLNYLFVNLSLLFVGCVLLKERDVDLLRSVSIASVFVNLLCMLVMGSTGMSLGEDNMGLSYSLVPHVCLLLFFSLKNRRTIDIISVIIGTIMVFAYGTRGPILCIAATFACSWFLLNRKKISFRKVLTISSLAVVLVVVLWEFMPVIGKVLLNSGMSDRIVGLLINGEFASDFGRSMIQDVVIDQIHKNPFGYGLAYDRVLTDWWGNDIEYSHNIVLELWVSFGVIIGSLLFLALLFLIIHGLRSAQTTKLKGFIVVLICSTGLLRLFLSGTFLDSSETYLLIGVCLGAIRQKSKRSKKKKVLEYLLKKSLLILKNDTVKSF